MHRKFCQETMASVIRQLEKSFYELNLHCGNASLCRKPYCSVETYNTASGTYALVSKWKLINYTNIHQFGCALFT